MTTTTLHHNHRPLTITTGIRRARPHVPYECPGVPGVCNVCHLPILVTHDGRYVNDRHMTLDELLRQLVVSEYDVMAMAAGERPDG